MGAVIIHQISLLSCVGPEPKVVALVRSVVKQTRYDPGGSQMVGQVTHSNK